MTPILKSPEWGIEHRPAAATQATISRAASTGKKHYCKSITATIAAVGTASGIVTAVLRDGASGGGTVLWSGKMNVPIGGSASIALSDLNIEGTPGTAMTLEFTAAGAAATEETVAMTGYTEA